MEGLHESFKDRLGVYSDDLTEKELLLLHSLNLTEERYWSVYKEFGDKSVKDLFKKYDFTKISNIFREIRVLKDRRFVIDLKCPKRKTELCSTKVMFSELKKTKRDFIEITHEIMRIVNAITQSGWEAEDRKIFVSSIQTVAKELFRAVLALESIEEKKLNAKQIASLRNNLKSYGSFPLRLTFARPKPYVKRLLDIDVALPGTAKGENTTFKVFTRVSMNTIIVSVLEVLADNGLELKEVRKRNAGKKMEYAFSVSEMHDALNSRDLLHEKIIESLQRRIRTE